MKEANQTRVNSWSNRQAAGGRLTDSNLIARVPLHGHAFPSRSMRFIRHRMHASGIDPSVVEIEEGADGDAKEEFLVGPVGGSRRGEIIGADTRRVTVHLVE